MRKKKNPIQYNTDEIYRGLRTHIEFFQLDEEIKIVNVVSTTTNEGKTTISVNLARIMAAKYENVLLIDADLRNPSTHRHLHINNEFGLTDLLEHYEEGKKISEYKGVCEHTFSTGEKLTVITAGHKVPNPSEVLGSRQLGSFLAQARREFEYIIIDCSPAAVTSDVIPLCNVSDGVLYVIDAKNSDKRKVKSAITDLQRNGVYVFGAVLNKVEELSNKHYGYGYPYINE